MNLVIVRYTLFSLKKREIRKERKNRPDNLMNFTKFVDKSYKSCIIRTETKLFCRFYFDVQVGHTASSFSCYIFCKWDCFGILCLMRIKLHYMLRFLPIMGRRFFRIKTKKRKRIWFFCRYIKVKSYYGKHRSEQMLR